MLTSFSNCYFREKELQISIFCPYFLGYILGVVSLTYQRQDCVPPGREIITCMKWSVGGVGAALLLTRPLSQSGLADNR